MSQDCKNPPLCSARHDCCRPEESMDSSKSGARMARPWWLIVPDAYTMGNGNLLPCISGASDLSVLQYVPVKIICVSLLIWNSPLTFAIRQKP